MKIAMPNLKLLLTAAGFSLLLTPSGGMPPDTASTSLFDLIHRDEILKIDLQTDLDQLLANRNTDAEVEAVLSFSGPNDRDYRFEIEIECRGKFRRRVCDFPPLKLNFSKRDLRELGLSRFDRLKLVTHCLEDQKGDDYLLKEYLIYRLYAELSPYHFRSQLVQVQYRDENGKKRYKRLGILLEDNDELAHRLQAEVVDTFSFREEGLEPENARLHALFQYMVGNADWNLALRRNLEILYFPGENTYRVVPYDFDFTGLVNVPYGIPNPDYRLTSMQQRVFLGEARGEQLQETIELLRRRRNRLEEVCRDLRYLRKRDEKDVLDYLGTFYAELDEQLIWYPETISTVEPE